MMHSLSADLRYAARELRRRPGFTLTALLSLALGAGATSAVFSVIYAVLINPFPWEPTAWRNSQGRHVPVSGVERSPTRATSPGQVHRKHRRRGWMEPHHDRRRPSRRCTGGIRVSKRTQSLGHSRVKGPLADPVGRSSGARAGTGGGARLPLLAKILWRRPGRRRTRHPACPQDLPDCRRDAAAVPLAGGRHLLAAQGHARPEYLPWGHHQNSPRCDFRSGQRRAAADSRAVRETIAGPVSGHLPRESAQHY